MRTKCIFVVAVLSFLAVAWTPAQAGVRIGVGIGVGAPYYYPYYPYYPYYYRPYYPVVVAPAPVVVASPQAPIAGQQPLYVQTAPGVFQMVTPQAAPQAPPQNATYYQVPARTESVPAPPPQPIPVTNVAH